MQLGGLGIHSFVGLEGLRINFCLGRGAMGITLLWEWGGVGIRFLWDWEAWELIVSGTGTYGNHIVVGLEDLFGDWAALVPEDTAFLVGSRRKKMLLTGSIATQLSPPPKKNFRSLKL